MDETRVFNPLDLQLSRSVYDWHPHTMGTCLTGRLYPGYFWNVLPGDEFSVNNLHSLFKMSTPVYPTMDYLYADIAFYFVPYKLIMSRRYGTPAVNDKEQSWAGFIGAQDALINMPIPADGVQLPVAPYDTGVLGSLGEYLYGVDGVVVSNKNRFPNALPLMSYLSIWNENYREPSLQDPITWSYVNYGSTGRKTLKLETSPLLCYSATEAGFDPGRSITKGAYDYVFDLASYSATPPAAYVDIGKSPCLPVSVFHGYFGSLLPWPQRNLLGVSIPVGTTAPILTSLGKTYNVGDDVEPMKVARIDTVTGKVVNPDNANHFLSVYANDTQVSQGTGAPGSGVNPQYGFAPNNLYADLSTATAVDVEMLRALITKQHWYEDIARSGNRLDELEYGTFGVRPKDSGCDRPMYLGGKRIQLNVEMVASTNGGTTSGPAQGAGSLGDLGAFSHTNDEGYYFHQGFDTWGAIMMVFTIRAHNLIASGIDRMHLKSTRDDWFWPEFANLGNERIMTAEVAPIVNVDSTLGYQEYAEEWREPRDQVHGLFIPGQSLGFMTYAHRFSSAPSINEVLDASKQFLDVDRTLAVQEAASGFQFVYQFTAETKVRRSVGKYSVPGVTRV